VLAVAPTRGKAEDFEAPHHQTGIRSRPAIGAAGIIDKESWLDISNVQICRSAIGKPSRVVTRSMVTEPSSSGDHTGHSIENDGFIH